MPSNCSVFGCHSSIKHRRNLTFHRFPKDEKLREQWIHRCSRNGSVNFKNAVICSLHFERHAFERNLKYELLGQPVPKALVRIKEGALPTLELPSSKKVPKFHGQESRAGKRKRKRIIQDLESDPAPEQMQVESRREKPSIVSVRELQLKVEELQRERDALLIEKEKWEKERVFLHSHLRSVVEAKAAIRNALRPFFSSSQVDFMLTKKPITKWTEDDLNRALTLHSLSPKAYWFLRDKFKFPFPCVATLNRWISKQKMERTHGQKLQAELKES